MLDEISRRVHLAKVHQVDLTSNLKCKYVQSATSSQCNTVVTFWWNVPPKHVVRRVCNGTGVCFMCFKVRLCKYILHRAADWHQSCKCFVVGTKHARDAHVHAFGKHRFVLPRHTWYMPTSHVCNCTHLTWPWENIKVAIK